MSSSSGFIESTSDNPYLGPPLMSSLGPYIPNIWTKIFVGGLKLSTTDLMFKKYFLQYGFIQKAFIVRSGTGNSRGFGFVTYARPESAKLAVQVAMQIVDGKQVEVKYAFIGAKMKYLRTTNTTSQEKDLTQKSLSTTPTLLMDISGYMKQDTNTHQVSFLPTQPVLLRPTQQVSFPLTQHQVSFAPAQSQDLYLPMKQQVSQHQVSFLLQPPSITMPLVANDTFHNNFITPRLHTPIIPTYPSVRFPLDGISNNVRVPFVPGTYRNHFQPRRQTPMLGRNIQPYSSNQFLQDPLVELGLLARELGLHYR